ncbi:MAG: hypothetical protein ACRDFB_07355 [Rhabdochlamydiaceae bacterium]
MKVIRLTNNHDSYLISVLHYAYRKAMEEGKKTMIEMIEELEPHIIGNFKDQAAS